MPSISLRDKCKINTNIDTDDFVGLRYIDGDISISFPLGYHLGESDEELRSDIFLLLNTLEKNTDRRESSFFTDARDYRDDVLFPLQAYLYVIKDYFSYGYFKETEISRCVAKRGKIDWPRTIKTQRTYLQDGDAYYLDFVTKKSQLNANELITLIHEYCVYNSFKMMGWLFSQYMPKRPRIRFQKKLFLSVLNEKIQNTFNDHHKKLFINMRAIVLWLGDGSSNSRYTFGTNRFEYVWERMLDRVYGISNKQEYFPHTIWNVDGCDTDNASLEPDSIMLWNNKIYVLDAKYYRFGWSGNPGDLPESTSINKQITYGEYIAESGKFKKNGNTPIVYNAFIMPFDSKGKKFYTDKNIRYAGTARSTWKLNLKEYEFIHGILLDVKHLMKCTVKLDSDEILEMAQAIDNAVSLHAIT